MSDEASKLWVEASRNNRGGRYCEADCVKNLALRLSAVGRRESHPVFRLLSARRTIVAPDIFDKIT